MMQDIRMPIRNLTYGGYQLKTAPVPKCWTNWRRDLYQASVKECEENRLFFWIVDAVAHA